MKRDVAGDSLDLKVPEITRLSKKMFCLLCCILCCQEKGLCINLKKSDNLLKI